ncbi:MAG: hypothetical protein ACLFTL_12405 [Alphaproteobacteria bacterium]
MRLTCKTEQRLFDHDELELLRQSHHPAIYGVDPAALAELRAQLRRLRDKETTLAREKRREVRGKGAARGGGFPGTVERPQARAAALTAALRRVGKELKRHAVLETRARHVEAARRAFALRRAAQFVHHPPAEPGAALDVQSVPSRRRRRVVAPSHVGRESQHTKVRQAVRDARPT